MLYGSIDHSRACSKNLVDERLSKFGGINELISRTFKTVAKSESLVDLRPTTMPEAIRNLEVDPRCKEYLAACVQELADAFVHYFAQREIDVDSSLIQFAMSMYRAGQSHKQDWVAQPFVIDCFDHAKDKEPYELAADSLDALTMMTFITFHFKLMAEFRRCFGPGADLESSQIPPLVDEEDNL